MGNIFKNGLTAVSKFGNRAGFWMKKNSPELLIATSIVGSVSSIALAIKATLKVEPVMKKANKEITEIKTKMNDDNLIANEQYSVKQGKQELAKAYAKTAWELTKLYGPSTLALSLSIFTMLNSHKIMKNRTASLAAAYTTVQTAYSNYRERVKDAIGEEKEIDIYRNRYKENQEVIVVDKKTGEEKVVTRKIKTPHMDPDSDFVYIFDMANPNFTPNSGRLNIEWLLMTEKFLNNKLVAQGYLFLNDVYEALGVDPGIVGESKMQASRVLGWLYDTNNPNGDNYVSFGIADPLGNLNQETMEMMRDRSNTGIWLEFNVDGDILTGNNGGRMFMKNAKGMFV